MTSELLQLLEQEARVERDKTLAEARARAEQILAAAQKEAEALQAEHRRRIEGLRAQARTQATSAASLKAAALLLQAKDEAIQSVFARATDELGRVAKDPARRRGLFRLLIEEAAQGLPTKRGILEVSPGDAGTATDVSKELGLTVEVKETPQVSGGVRLTSEDRRIIVENTVASRLSRARTALVSRVAEILWGS
jgi:V/A-type H+-transporting ATPase subunit E